MSEIYDYQGTQAADRDFLEERSRFLVRTYNHLFGAIVAFAAIEIALFTTGIAQVLARALLGTSWLLVIGGFVLVSWLASRVAHQAESKVAQYAALGGFVVAEAILFVPLLAVANHFAPGAISSAGLVTILGFAALTGLVLWSRRDFSFLGALLKWGGVMALVAIVAAVIFGFQLGTLFSVAMVGFAGAAILYDTSSVLHHYPEDRYVAAALELFASVALLFWYVLRIFVASRD
ncbi:MAG: US12 family protein [Polyangiaceae bacterium]|nr:US12 family protein [Polyangiaceae bacterium]